MIRCKKRKDDVNMCRKLAELHNKKPNDFLSGNPKLPVDIYQILQDLNVRCFCVNFNGLQKDLAFDNAKIIGLAYAHKNDLFIFYSDHSDLPTARFTLAHELAHCCLHMNDDAAFHIEMQTIPDVIHFNGKASKSFNRKKEVEADVFARELLIPTNALIHILRSVKDPSIEELADLFIVPKEEIANKLIDVKTHLLSQKRK